jgi:hypothetical protein
LLLPFGQPLAQGLLRVLHVAFDGFLVAGHFFDPQVGQRGHDRQKEDQNRRQWHEHGQSVLAVRIEIAPPALQAAYKRPWVSGVHQGCVGLCIHRV